MRRGVLILLTVGLLVVAAAVVFFLLDDNSDIEEPADPVALLTEAADKIRAVETFGIEIRQTGVEYKFQSNLGQGVVDVGFRRAIGQYVSPDQIQLTVSIQASGLTVGVLVYGHGDDQWYQLPVFGWQHDAFAAGFNPETLIAEDTGFQAALASLVDLEYDGVTSIDGTDAYKLSGSANGSDVTDLLVGMIEDEGRVNVEVFIDVETRYPIRINIIQIETDPDDPMTWIVDLFDINAEPDLILPPELAAEGGA